MVRVNEVSLPTYANRVKFRYENWRGDEHEYVVEPQAVAFGNYDGGGLSLDGSKRWVLHGYVVTRDGDDRRRELGSDRSNHRRTFLLEEIVDLEAADA